MQEHINNAKHRQINLSPDSGSSVSNTSHAPCPTPHMPTSKLLVSQNPEEQCRTWTCQKRSPDTRTPSLFCCCFSACVMHDLPNPQTRRREKADFDRSGKPWSVSVLFHAANSMWICERLCWRSMHLGYVCCRKPVSSQVDLSKLIQNFVVAVKRESMIMLCF
jgi:hypothetical protein